MSPPAEPVIIEPMVGQQIGCNGKWMLDLAFGIRALVMGRNVTSFMAGTSTASPESALNYFNLKRLVANKRWHCECLQECVVVRHEVDLLVNWRPKEKPKPPNPGHKVWVKTRSGFYYCPESGVFGKTKPGLIMGQGEALQEGYQPVDGHSCGAPSE